MKKRPDRESFCRLCDHLNVHEIASMLGVTASAVYEWGVRYDCKPKAIEGGVGVRATQDFVRADELPMPATPGPINGYWLAARGCGGE